MGQLNEATELYSYQIGSYTDRFLAGPGSEPKARGYALQQLIDYEYIDCSKLRYENPQTWALLVKDAKRHRESLGKELSVLEGVEFGSMSIRSGITYWIYTTTAPKNINADNICVRLQVLRTDESRKRFLSTCSLELPPEYLLRSMQVAEQKKYEAIQARQQKEAIYRLSQCSRINQINDSAKREFHDSRAYIITDEQKRLHQIAILAKEQAEDRANELKRDAKYQAKLALAKMEK